MRHARWTATWHVVVHLIADAVSPWLNSYCMAWGERVAAHRHRLLRKVLTGSRSNHQWAKSGSRRALDGKGWGLCAFDKGGEWCGQR
jgi:hypothetical protein